MKSDVSRKCKSAWSRECILEGGMWVWPDLKGLHTLLAIGTVQGGELSLNDFK